LAAGGLMHAQRWTPARWVAAPQCQPTNADSRRGHIRMTLTTGPDGLPHPATWASLPDTDAWTIARNCPIAQVRYTLYNGAALSAVRFLLNPLSPVTYIYPVSLYRNIFLIIYTHNQPINMSQNGYRRLHLVGAATVSFCKHVTCLQRKHG